MPNDKRVLTPEEMREAAGVLRCKASLGVGVLSRREGAAALEAVAGQEVVGYVCDKCDEYIAADDLCVTKCCGGTLVPVGEIVKVEVEG